MCVHTHTKTHHTSYHHESRRPLNEGGGCSKALSRQIRAWNSWLQAPSSPIKPHPGLRWVGEVSPAPRPPRVSPFLLWGQIPACVSPHGLPHALFVSPGAFRKRRAPSAFFSKTNGKVGKSKTTYPNRIWHIFLNNLLVLYGCNY